jgi:PilZ domain
MLRTVSLDSRKHPRALLNLPVRLRWYGPLGMRLETTHTIDSAREGLLVRRAEPCEVAKRVWVAFPYDAQAAVQAEIPAKVVRVERDLGGSFRVALKLEFSAWQPTPDSDVEHRGEPRLRFALPIFVRPVGTPWPEESMTQDLSGSGVRFETAQVYEPGEDVLAKIPWGPWAERGEIQGRVTRVEMVENGPRPDLNSDGERAPGTFLTRVAVRWTANEKS